VDKIAIHGLRVPALLGVHDWERRVRQIVVLDVEMSVDTRRAASEGRLALAVDYGQVARDIRAHIGERHVDLVETLAEQIAALVLGKFDVKSVRVRITKPRAIPHAAGASIEIERAR
jgi:dihydroneopterin aldolase